MSWVCLSSDIQGACQRSTLVKRGDPLVYIVACEASGDQIGALLIKALNVATNGEVAFAGIGGPQMCAAGLNRLFDPKELALLGIFEVLPKALQVLDRVAATLKDIESKQPDILVTIDSWGFTGRIHQRLARKGSVIPRLRYVAPQVWAWRPGRAKQLSQWIHHLLALLPFEPDYFTRHGLPTSWVGHPVVESGFGDGDGTLFRTRHGIPSAETVICLLPGSRRSEVSRLLPVFSETIERLSRSHPRLHVILPTVESVADIVQEVGRNWPVDGVTVVTNDKDRRDAFAASDVALAASGTVSLELAAASVPHVIAYKVNPLSALAFRALAKTKRVNLVNIVLDCDAVPERLQGQCCADILTEDVNLLLTNEKARAAQRAYFAEAISRLTPTGKQPSQRAAEVILSLIGNAAR